MPYEYAYNYGGVRGVRTASRRNRLNCSCNLSPCNLSYRENSNTNTTTLTLVRATTHLVQAQMIAWEMIAWAKEDPRDRRVPVDHLAPVDRLALAQKDPKDRRVPVARLAPVDLLAQRDPKDRRDPVEVLVLTVPRHLTRRLQEEVPHLQPEHHSRRHLFFHHLPRFRSLQPPHLSRNQQTLRSQPEHHLRRRLFSLHLPLTR